MALDVNGSAGGLGGERASRADRSIIYSQDVKCLLCGFVSGQLVGDVSLPIDARAFTPAPGQRPPPGFQSARARCFRCGGPCFLDEVETTVRLRDEVLEKPRRGRKPKNRPVVSA
jgi:hypothetical protein